ncbi:hypothetical protein [uncultured Parasutterella sp.]|nr:hypothetical protein [uncultured Parasutterella sp.]
MDTVSFERKTACRDTAARTQTAQRKSRKTELSLQKFTNKIRLVE